MREHGANEGWRLAVFAALGLLGCSDGDVERTELGITGAAVDPTVDPTVSPAVDPSVNPSVDPAVDPNAGVGGTASVPTTSLGREVACTQPAEGANVVQCLAGASRRVAGPTCEDRRTERPAELTGVPATDSFRECEFDSDCTATALSYCLFTVPIGSSCQVGCREDADCQATERCDCTANLGVCLPSGCRTDADCEPGATCLSWQGDCGYSSFACTTDTDTCHENADCPEGTHCGASTAGRSCVANVSACPVPGRPFFVAGEVRVASVWERSDWGADRAEAAADAAAADAAAARDSAARDSAACDSAACRAAQRERIGRHWLRAALMEHASIASFARFQLQLLALGAPAELVSGVQIAMADEIRHARACFAVASAYLERHVGPGVLDVGDALGGSAADRQSNPFDPRRILRDLILEGCVGETCAAIEAEAAAASAVPLHLREVLHGIAADEKEHGLLAWRTLSWLVRTQPKLLDEVRRILGELRLDEATPSAGADEDQAHGVLSPRLRQELRADALRTIVCPALLAFVEAGPPEHDPVRSSADRAFGAVSSSRPS